jgi:hypothetical protein
MISGLEVTTIILFIILIIIVVTSEGSSNKMSASHWLMFSVILSLLLILVLILVVITVINDCRIFSFGYVFALTIIFSLIICTYFSKVISQYKIEKLNFGADCLIAYHHIKSQSQQDDDK